MAIAIVMGAGTVTASSERASTNMYLGQKLIGSIDRAWLISCDYEGGYVTRGRLSRRMNVHFFDGMLAGYSHLETNGRWTIYKLNPFKLAGVAARKSATRWDISRGRRKIGHTVGPDGPAAATALLTIC
jgi:hypothetical protein